MVDGLLLMIAGGLLVVVGIAVAGGTRRPDTRYTQTGISVFGDVRQTMTHVGAGLSGARGRTPRDWIGLGLSVAGLAVGLIGLAVG